VCGLLFVVRYGLRARDRRKKMFSMGLGNRFSVRAGGRAGCEMGEGEGGEKAGPLRVLFASFSCPDALGRAGVWAGARSGRG